MNVLFCASECVPFVKTGGLADVAGTLPPALKSEDIDIRVVLPKYRDIPEEYTQKLEHVAEFYIGMGWRNQYCGIEKLELDGCTYYFIDSEYYFRRDSIYGSGTEEGERFGFFCRAVLEMIGYIGFKPDIIHCNDWQTGMVPVLYKLQYSGREGYENIRTLFTIHNLKFQGTFEWNWIADILHIGKEHFSMDDLEYYGNISFMKGGLLYSDYISTVSPSYAYEIQTSFYGERMDGILRQRSDRLFGILNGIDTKSFNPATDKAIAKKYSRTTIQNKQLCKADLQREFGLNEDPRVPVIGIVSRLTDQKGFDLIEYVISDIMRMDLQLAVVGVGEARYSDMLKWASWQYGGKVAVRFEVSDSIARKVYAGSDMFLMPSLFEPCGLSQMIALRYGSVPIVRETGGLIDTVEPYNKFANTGTGFAFKNINAHDMLYTIENAVDCYYNNPAAYKGLIERGMKADFSWKRSAKQYASLYAKMLD